jgi:anti-sigma factor RsiW
MNCNDSRIYLAAYFDDELDVAQSLRVHQHLAGCPDCRQVQREQLVLRSALRNSALYAHPSAEFSKRIEAVVRRAARIEARTQRTSWLGSFRFDSLQWSLALAALLAITTIGAFVIINGLRPSHEQIISTAVLESHIRSLQPGHLIDVPSSDRHTVKPWFQGKLDFSPPVPDLSELGWTLVGGRLDYVDGRPVAALVYQRRQHEINVFLWPSHNSALYDNVRQENAQGYQILHWNGAETTYWVVSDLNNAELLDFARALRGH